MRYHLKFVYHDTIVRVSRYTLGIEANVHYKIWPFHILVYEIANFITLIEILLIQIKPKIMLIISCLVILHNQYPRYQRLK